MTSASPRQRAVRTLRACSRDDHARARQLHDRSTNENGRSHKLRSARLKSRSQQYEDRSRELAAEADRAGRPTSRYRLTELGREARCSKCQTFWPADAEFFYMRGTAPHSWCKACYVNDRIATGTTQRTGRGRVRDDHVVAEGG